MSHALSTLAYLVASVLFILALRGLSHPETSRQGVQFGMIGMGIAILASLLTPAMSLSGVVLVFLGLAIGGAIGAVVAQRIQMTALPQLVAAFHSLVGMAAVFVAAAAFYAPESFGIGTRGDIHGASLVEMSLGLAIGAITFSGSVIAFLKLDGRMSGKPITYATMDFEKLAGPAETRMRLPFGPVRNLGVNVLRVYLEQQHRNNLLLGITLLALVILFVITGNDVLFWAIALLSFLLGFLLIIPIGGADMPVVVSMLNSYSGWAAAGIGFTVGNLLLIVTGALVGASGAILSYIMCKGMNRSIVNVLLGGFGSDSGVAAAADASDRPPVKAGSPEDAAYIMKNAQKIIVVPGYGMAVAQAQQVLREMADLLKKEGADVSYAIHPVAGRMPGHMNVLLAEANVPYDDVHELEEINPEFAEADVAYVIGANDVTNPAAKTDRSSPIYGMPILDVERAKTVFFVKRGMSSGYSGVENELFYRPNTMMLFGDAKKVTQEIVQSLQK